MTIRVTVTTNPSFHAAVSSEDGIRAIKDVCQIMVASMFGFHDPSELDSAVEVTHAYDSNEEYGFNVAIQAMGYRDAEDALGAAIFDLLGLEGTDVSYLVKLSEPYVSDEGDDYEVFWDLTRRIETGRERVRHVLYGADVSALI